MLARREEAGEGRVRVYGLVVVHTSMALLDLDPFQRLRVAKVDPPVAAKRHLVVERRHGDTVDRLPELRFCDRIQWSRLAVGVLSSLRFLLGDLESVEITPGLGRC